MSLHTQDFDIVIVGASFAGLTCAHHLPKNLKVLVIDSKPSAGFSVESTGLITVRTREEFAQFFPIDDYITNPITSICVIAPNFKDHFISHTDHSWIFQTDTKGLVQALAKNLPDNVTLQAATTITALDNKENPHELELLSAGKKTKVTTKFLVGADGGHSRVAQLTGLSRNTRFLVGYEQVFFGEVHLGPRPQETIYHYWFGEFSLGYGGWLSPTFLNGRSAFRIGLAKLPKDHHQKQELIKKFTNILRDNGTLTLDEEKPFYQFGNMIPLGGALKKVHKGNVLLIGDAAGLCGAFAADGIKGSVVSGKISARLITEFLEGKKQALKRYHALINSHGGLMDYYTRQLRYRFIWDKMRRDRTFTAMFNIISAESESFLAQFCDSKDKRKSLARIVFKVRHLPKLFVYGFFIVIDMITALFSSGKARS